MKTILVIVMLASGAGYYIKNRPMNPKPVVLLQQDKSLSISQSKTGLLSRDDFERLIGLVLRFEGTFGFQIISDGAEDIVQLSPRNVAYDTREKKKWTHFEEAVLERLRRPWTRKTDLHSALHRANAFCRPLADRTRNCYLILVSDGQHDADRSKQPALAEHIQVLVVSPVPLKNFPDADQFESIGAAIDHIQEKERGK